LGYFEDLVSTSKVKTVKGNSKNTMVAHYHGQVWNAAEPTRTLGVSESTTRRHLDLLTDAFMIRQLNASHWQIK